MPQVVQPPPTVHFNRDGRRPSLEKQGDFGFVESVDKVTNKYEDETAESGFPLPVPRHRPADKGYRPSTQLPTPTVNETRPVNEYAPNSFTEPKQIRSVGGVRVATLLLCAIQLIAMGGTIAIWVFTTTTVQAILVAKHQNTAGSLTVFIHVAFVFIFLAQLVFLQRAIHRLRRERHQHLRPGQRPPLQHSRSSYDSLAAHAPWNQPQTLLPMYLTQPQSGIATRDVESNPMSIPPPPAYGSMRESTLPHSFR